MAPLWIDDNWKIIWKDEIWKKNFFLFRYKTIVDSDTLLNFLVKTSTIWLYDFPMQESFVFAHYAIGHFHNYEDKPCVIFLKNTTFFRNLTKITKLDESQYKWWMKMFDLKNKINGIVERRLCFFMYLYLWLQIW